MLRTALLALVLILPWSSTAAPVPRYRPLVLTREKLAGLWVLTWHGTPFDARFRADGTCSTGAGWGGVFTLGRKGNDVTLSITESHPEPDGDQGVLAWDCVVTVHPEGGYRLTVSSMRRGLWGLELVPIGTPFECRLTRAK